MRLAIDGVTIPIRPDTVSWTPPRVVGRDGEGAPVLTPTWSCTLSFPLTTERGSYSWWYEAWDGEHHTFSLPHPVFGRVFAVGYIDQITPRLDNRSSCDAAVIGLDITLSRLSLNLP